MLGLTTKFFVQTLIAAFITMIFIYIIKKASNRFKIPFVSDIAEGV